jgi:phosphatidylserine decarboxylase
VLSPADGKVLFIKKLEHHKFIDGPAWQISIFMSPLDVHVNRIPISGIVEYLNYIKGEYIVAFHDKADDRNERNEVGIISPLGKVFFTQVAGFIARRIVSELNKGDRVTIGNKFGMIKFGSRSDVIVGEDWMVAVKEGEHVSGGETILYEKKNVSDK